MRKMSGAAIAGAVVLTLTAQLEVHAEDVSGTVVEAGNASALEAALREHGWTVERNPEGDLIVHPPGPMPGSPEPAVSAAQVDSDQVTGAHDPGGESTLELQLGRSDPDADTVDAGDLDALKALAEERGWGTRSEPDGSLLLYPPQTRTSAEDPEACQIGMTRIADTEGHPLPAQTEDQVHRLAQAWLREQGSESLAVGRIRQINRLHVASIVSAEPPHFLHAQLVVHAGSGCLMAIQSQ